MNRITAEIRILHSVHAADIGRLINPMQCRGQIEGAIAMGFGWALTENMVHGADGTIVNPSLRNYRIPAFADVPAGCETPPAARNQAIEARSHCDSANKRKATSAQSKRCASVVGIHIFAPSYEFHVRTRTLDCLSVIVFGAGRELAR